MTGAATTDGPPPERLGARAGRPRDADETPLEYQAAVSDFPPFDVRAADLDAVTALYADVRYGDQSPPPDAVGAAEAAVRDLTSHRRRGAYTG